MVHFIYGRTGSGKTGFMLECAAATHGKHIFVLVPDRGAVMAERAFSYAPNAGDIDVVTFSRLSNFVFRRYGGLCESYISRGATHSEKLTAAPLHGRTSSLRQQY